MSVKVSVIVSVYNVEKYIEASLRAICAQDFDSYEIIVVNDGTKDHSALIAEQLLKDCGIPYTILNKENGGLPSARNAGLQIAQGEYVCFIDSDDVIEPTHLADLWSCCKERGLIASYALFQLTYEDNRLGVPTKGNLARAIPRKEVIYDFMIRKIKVHCCALMIRRDYLMENHILFNEKLRYGEDIDFMWRLFPTLDALGCTGNETYMYLQRTNSLMTSQSIDRVMLLMDEFRKTTDGLMERYPEDRDVLKFLFGKAALAFYRSFAESSEYELFVELLRKTNYKRTIGSMLGINSYKLKALGVCLILSPKIFSKVVKKNRETAVEVNP